MDECSQRSLPSYPDSFILSLQSPLVEPQADNSSEPLPSTAETASSAAEEDVHYASLSFREMKPKSPQGQQDTTTEYSEIKFHK